MALTLFNDRRAGRAHLEIGLVNNMPDSALEATESQFSNLLANAAGQIDVRLRLYSLPEIVRGDAARRRIADHYCDLKDLWDSDLDALIVAGTEPRHPDLRQEVYWSNLTALIEWARTRTLSSIWSCLAAHAAVLYLDGIAREPLASKCCGVYGHDVIPHPLTAGLAAPQRTPHSRWNSLSRSALEEHGYLVLTNSALAGVNLFVKPLGSLFVFWQGHPEYDDRSLLKEYQRDVQRFLRRERDTYPNMPYGYFSAAAAQRMSAFEHRARSAPSEDLVSEFPFEFASAELKNTWRTGAIQAYENWLNVLLEAQAARGVPRSGPATENALPVPER